MKKYNKISYENLDAKIIKFIEIKSRTLKARTGQRSQSASFKFSTSQWEEPTNEFRKKVN